MPRYAIQYRTGDGLVVGVVAITDASPIPVPLAGTAFEIVTEAQHTLARQVRLDTYERTAPGVYARIGEARWFARLDTDGFVVGLRSGPGTALAGERELTDAERDVIRDGGRLVLEGGGGFRWRIVDDVLTEVTDARPVLTFTPAVVDARVGGAGVDVTVQVFAPDGTTPLGFTGEREIETSVGTLALNFTAGKATLTVPTARPLVAEVRSQAQFRTVDGLSVRVLATSLS